MPSAADTAARHAIHGRLFEARSAASQPATLHWREDGSLLLRYGQRERALPAGSVRWSSRIGTAARRAALPGESTFETADNDQVDRLERLHGRRSHLLHRLERLNMPGLALAALVTLAFLVSLRWTIPWLGDAIARTVPSTVETRLGNHVLRTLDQAVLRPSQLSPDRQRAIQAVFEALVANAEAAPQRPRLLFRQGGPLVGANAMALPGGSVIVTDELARQAETPDMLAGVLAHEIGHIQHRHGIRRLGRLAGLSTVTILFSGDASSLLHEASVLGTGLLDLSYSRAFEHEADATAVALLRKAGKDPALLAALLQRLSAQSAMAGAMPNWLSSHPSTQARTRFILEGR
ncbi:MAG: M48 family metallopeptidase [Achromobacter sp.]|uniref:M48 family metallopeptidase n=1 Tax=Achromobacter sp. TaxID=134375 RepID=UPI003D002CC1